MKDSNSRDRRDLQLYPAPNEILQVRIPDDPNPVTYYSRVISLSKGVLNIPWPTDRGIRLITHPGDVLDFYFIRGGTPHIFSGVVGGTDSGPLPQISVAIDSPAQQIQRRQNYRVKCLLPIEVVGTLPADGPDGSTEPLSIKTVSSDISAGGISFRSVKKIPDGTLLTIQLFLPDKGPRISIPCSVIYSEFVSEHQTLYRTALRYIALSEGERARIVRFIYRMQLRGLHS